MLVEFIIAVSQSRRLGPIPVGRLVHIDRRMIERKDCSRWDVRGWKVGGAVECGVVVRLVPKGGSTVQKPDFETASTEFAGLDADLE